MKKRLLILVNTVTFLEQAGPGLVSPTTRRVNNTRPTGHAGDHLAVQNPRLLSGLRRPIQSAN